MRKPESQAPVEPVTRVWGNKHSRASDERAAELEMFRVLLESMKKRHIWDRIKCAIATGIPVFWILVILLRSHIPPAISSSVPPWLAELVGPVLEDVPFIWTVAVSLAIAGFQWYNLAHYHRQVIPLVRDMYERAMTRREPALLSMLGESLRLTSLRESFRRFFQKLSPGPPGSGGA
jgi:hypothetical protein